MVVVMVVRVISRAASVVWLDNLELDRKLGGVTYLFLRCLPLHFSCSCVLMLAVVVIEWFGEQL